MRIIVCIKQIYDPKTVKISRSREELDLREAGLILNPPDRYALEVGLRLREAAGGEVLALTLGGADAEDVAREAVAIGADRAVLVTGEWKSGLSLASNIVTSLLAAAVRRLDGDGFALVLTGQIGLTDGTGSLAPRLGAALGWPVVLDAVRVVQEADGMMTAHVARTGEGLAVLVSPPAVVAVMPGPERPRYAYPARIANAWGPGLVEVWTAADLGVDVPAPDTEPANLILGPERTRGQRVGGTVPEAAKSVADLLRAKRLA